MILRPVARAPANRRHRGLGAGADEAHLFNGRIAGHDALGQIALGAVEAPKLAELRAARSIASTTGGNAWPRIIGPQEPK
jgi:hypothetical protein